MFTWAHPHSQAVKNLQSDSCSRFLEGLRVLLPDVPKGASVISIRIHQKFSPKMQF